MIQIQNKYPHKKAVNSNNRYIYTHRHIYINRTYTNTVIN